MNKKFLEYLLIFCGSFLFSFIFFYVLGSVYCDEVWVYGFSYNISKGMVIYRDFNVLQMPLYFFIASVFIKIFGNYIIVMHIFDSLLFASMIIIIYKIIGKKVFIMLPLFIFFWPSGYNLLCLFFLILLIYLIHKNKDSDLLVGFIVGLCFITKQNIGILLLIPCLFYSKRKLKTLICFIIPFVFLSIYLIYNDAFYQFIDYCFLGMFDFQDNNEYFPFVFVVVSLVNILFLVFLNVKNKLKNKELFYILFFQIIVYPIFDIRHYVCALFPVIYLILKYLKNKSMIFLFGFFIISLYISLVFDTEYTINFKKNLDFLRNSGNLDFFSAEVIRYVGDNENFFFTDYYNYYIKLYYDIPIGQYDLLLSGNVGYNGVEKKLKKLDKMCKREKCYFFTEKIDKSGILSKQYIEFYNYIVNNYNKVDNLFMFDVYTNDIEGEK